MKHRILLLFFALTVCLAGAQTDDDWFWNKPIDSFQWEGIKQASRKELDALTRPFLGKPFTELRTENGQNAVEKKGGCGDCDNDQEIIVEIIPVIV